MSRTVGFVGLGVMGRPMARHILQRLTAEGGRLLIWDSRRERHQDLLESGAHWADSLGALAVQCDVVVVMVPEIRQVREVVWGGGGLAEYAARPLILVVSSTCSAQEMRELAADLKRHESPITVVDAPVSGGAEGAHSGTLSIMMGGSTEAAAVAAEVLCAAGTPVHLGPLGAGQVAKACNQLIVAAEVVALAEASLLAERAGLDVAQLFAVLQRGYAGSRMMEVKAQRFIDRDHSPSGPARFMVKDLRAVAEEASVSGLNLVSIEALRSVFGALTESGLGDYDTSVVQAYIEQTSRPQLEVMHGQGEQVPRAVCDD